MCGVMVCRENMRSAIRNVLNRDSIPHSTECWLQWKMIYKGPACGGKKFGLGMQPRYGCIYMGYVGLLTSTLGHRRAGSACESSSAAEHPIQHYEVCF